MFASNSDKSPSSDPAADASTTRLSDYSQAKCREWSQKGAYPWTARISALMSDPTFCTASAWPPTKNFYCFANSDSKSSSSGKGQNQLLLQLAESLRLLGWSALDVNGAAATICRLKQPAGLLIASPEVWTKLKQRGDVAKFACCLAYWEQRLSCFETYWQLHEALAVYEQGLGMFVDMGLLGESVQPRLSFEDILLPTINLGETWGRKLARFLKAHDNFRLRNAAAAPGSSPVCEELEFIPGRAEKSGRKRLEQLDTMRKGGRSDLTWSGLILQACLTSPKLVIGRGFRLETFLLIAPRRNSAAFGFAAFLHPGLIRIDASETLTTAEESQPQVQDEAATQPHQQPPHLLDSSSRIKLRQVRRSTFSWLPDQLSDYLQAVESDEDSHDWLNSTAYPQVHSACAYLCVALGHQHLLDSPYTRFQLIRLSFVADAESHQLRLDDFSQRAAEFNPQPTLDFCESLVLPRVFQESALIVVELLVRSSSVADLAARNLVSPHNMKLVFDSMEPGVQRALLSKQNVAHMTQEA